MTYDSAGNGNAAAAPEGANAERPCFVSNLSDISTVAQYMNRVGAHPRSLRTAAITESDGRYPRTIATIHLDKTGQITVRAEEGEDATRYEPTDAERALIAAETMMAKWPESLKTATGRNLPPEIQNADPEDVFEFRDADGNIVMIQLRVEKDGDKRYVPYTYWSDNKWRMMEPEGLLPLWGMDQLNRHSIVFLHEGAKAARACRRLAEAWCPQGDAALAAHPWGDDLKHAAHLGWIGGALSPHRTDWSVLQKLGVKRIIIVADNDAPGIAAVPKIAKALRYYPINVEAVLFTNEWPKGFDLADPFPPRMFTKLNGIDRYVGPSLADCRTPATWATRIGTASPATGRGRPPPAPIFLRPEFVAQWIMVVLDSGTYFAPADDPTRLYGATEFDTLIRPFSDVRSTSETFKRHGFESTVYAVAYEPGHQPGIITHDRARAINTHIPARIASAKGDIGPFDLFMENLLPIESDRWEVKRWIATLIARPDIRMRYGLLLTSIMQGVGKTTLGSDVLRPLVGERNCSAPSAKDVVDSAFNSWIVRKRLVIVNEIYEGKNWTAYNKLKSYVTDTSLDVNEKYKASYTVRNWAHFILCSNSVTALSMDQHDRRFLVPTLTEEKQSPDYWARFHAWLAGGGLGLVRHWATDFVSKPGGFVRPGEDAPMTARKQQLIEDSRSPEERLVTDLAAAARDRAEGRQLILVVNEIIGWLSHQRSRDRDMKPAVIKVWLTGAGLHVPEKRLRIAGDLSHIASTLPVDEGAGWRELSIARISPDELSNM